MLRGDWPWPRQYRQSPSTDHRDVGCRYQVLLVQLRWVVRGGSEEFVLMRKSSNVGMTWPRSRRRRT